MTSGVLEPLAVFASQSKSQRYIKAIRDLGDTWRSPAEIPLTGSEKDSAVLETNFDFVLRITNALGSKSTTVEMSTQERIPMPIRESSLFAEEPSMPTTPVSTTPPMQPDSARDYRIFADYGTDFIWRDPDDLRPELEEGDCMLEAEEVLSSFPSSVFELYDAWVDTYTNNFRERREKTQNYGASTFATVSEEVAWNVAGFLLAWRITRSPEVGRMEFGVGGSKYYLKKRKETSVTLEFLQDQIDILAKGEPEA
jgi:hypothetical protein